MGSTKHEKSFVDFDKPYEQNIIGLKGILYFGIGLLLLIVITFGLMAALLGVLYDNAAESAGPVNPMAMTEKEALPPEPRLQTAPGFGVEAENGRVNLELMAPQAEYWELEKQWEELWKNGQKDPKTGAVAALSIDQAKERFLQQNVKAKTGPEVEAAVNESRKYVSDASSGRLASETRR